MLPKPAAEARAIAWSDMHFTNPIPTPCTLCLCGKMNFSVRSASSVLWFLRALCFHFRFVMFEQGVRQFGWLIVRNKLNSK